MHKIEYKPLSVNRVWQGKRFKTSEYSKYERDLLLILPQISIPPSPYRLELEFGMSLSSDVDNPTKPFLDILQKKYGINDKNILHLIIKKTVVKKGNEFIKFNLTHEKAHSDIS